MDHKEEHQSTIYNIYNKLEQCYLSSVDHHLLIICWLSSVVIICRSSVAHHLLIMFLYQILLFCYYENWQGDSRDSVVKTPPPWVRIIKWIVTFSVGICWSSSEDHLLIICWLPWKFISRTDEMRGSDILEDKVPIDIIIWRMLTFSEICSNSGIFGLIGHLLELGWK